MIEPSSRRRLLLLACVVVGTATADAPRLQAGLWNFTNVPTGASLNGRALGDLPYTPPETPERVCVSAEEAADPAAWFARDVGQGCRFSRREVGGGRVDLIGACPSNEAGRAAGSVALTGRWTPSSYDLRFRTETEGENGRMGFTGTMTGRRVGDCPAK